MLQLIGLIDGDIGRGRDLFSLCPNRRVPKWWGEPPSRFSSICRS